ncbi:MAG TPA: hypothetical protein VJI98_01340 [Candidatus Nanoarchaeia archaeon]|nr:hypothetical protein [Candidatus Nanoarchaeia archaeon]
MAWFHKSLQNMKKAIEQENWSEVKKILQQHRRSLDKHAPEVQHDLSDIAGRISQYGEDITQISILLANRNRNNNKNYMLAKVNSAINEAFFFEETIMHLIKERKFMK